VARATPVYVLIGQIGLAKPIWSGRLATLEVNELHQEARNAHYALSHGSAGAMQQKLDTAFWHPELVLAVQQTVAECSYYQLMKKPNVILPNLVPIKPPPPLTR
jgi:hypothetical protein